MFSIILETARGVLKSLIMLFTFVTTLMVCSVKKVHETSCCSSSIAYQDKRADWILRIFTFNDKNPFYLIKILTLEFFEDHSDQGVSQLLKTPFDIIQSSKIVSIS